MPICCITEKSKLKFTHSFFAESKKESVQVSLGLCMNGLDEAVRPDTGSVCRVRYPVFWYICKFSPAFGLHRGAGGVCGD